MKVVELEIHSASSKKRHGEGKTEERCAGDGRNRGTVGSVGSIDFTTSSCIASATATDADKYQMSGSKSIDLGVGEVRTAGVGDGASVRSAVQRGIDAGRRYSDRPWVIRGLDEV